ncbi:MAG: beta-ketoacyl synthase chain length factor [Bacteroidales bacterium]|nr:beta-ketoacyl synthase chain length factor [Bacteroidales bacterium]
MSVYIQSASHISIQEPLSEKWFTEPQIPEENFNLSIEPDYKQFIAPIEARRMGKLLKRAVTTSADALRKGGCEMPDAIITGTGLGCIENTEKFLNAMLDNDEECMPPTAFMQSTHNTISSQVALTLKCHGYNCTYSQQGFSFDSALLDAFMQFQLGRIGTALVEGHDEMSPDYYRMLGKIGYWKKEAANTEILREGCGVGSISGSSSVAILLSNKLNNNTLCEIKNIITLHCPDNSEIKTALENLLSESGITMNDIDAIVTGLSGDEANDAVYKEVAANCFNGKPLVWYKHIFGESFCASAFGIYIGATIISKGFIPEHLLYKSEKEIKNVSNILIYNHFQNKNHSLTLLQTVKG